MRRAKHDALLPREDEQIRGDLRALRVLFDGDAYRVLYAPQGARGQVLLALHVVTKKSPKLPAATRRLAESRLADWRRRGG